MAKDDKTPATTTLTSFNVDVKQWEEFKKLAGKEERTASYGLNELIKQAVQRGYISDTQNHSQSISDIDLSGFVSVEFFEATISALAEKIAPVDYGKIQAMINGETQRAIAEQIDLSPIYSRLDTLENLRDGQKELDRAFGEKQFNALKSDFGIFESRLKFLESKILGDDLMQPITPESINKSEPVDLSPLENRLDSIEENLATMTAIVGKLTQTPDKSTTVESRETIAQPMIEPDTHHNVESLTVQVETEPEPIIEHVLAAEIVQGETTTTVEDEPVESKPEKVVLTEVEVCPFELGKTYRQSKLVEIFSRYQKNNAQGRLIQCWIKESKGLTSKNPLAKIYGTSQFWTWTDENSGVYYTFLGANTNDTTINAPTTNENQD